MQGRTTRKREEEEHTGRRVNNLSSKPKWQEVREGQEKKADGKKDEGKQVRGQPPQAKSNEAST
jgi:hypothetical protein